MALEDLLDAGEEFKDVALGELNDLSFDMESPLITNELNGKSLFSYLMENIVERKNVFDVKKQHKGIVLLAAQMQTAGVTNQVAYVAAKTVHKTDRSGTGGVTAQPDTVIRNFAFVRVPEIHAHIPSPSMRLLLDTDFTAADGSAQLPADDKLKISMHSAYYSSPINEDTMRGLVSGDIVLLDGDGIIIKVLEGSGIEEFVGGGGSLAGVDWAFGNTLGSSRDALDALSDLAVNSAFDDPKIITGTDVAGVTGLVEEETAFWSGKTEKDEDTHQRLALYYEKTSLGSNWTPSGTPWSAAYISYIVNTANPNFKGSALHTSYVNNAVKGAGGYGLVEINNNKDKIQANIGDIFVKDRSGSATASHGDVVWKIDLPAPGTSGGGVFLSGGNLGDSVKSDITVGVDDEGYYTSFGEYEVIVKYQPVVTEATSSVT